ncbi:Peroxisomal 2 like protein [Verticillium longisporum]|nr:Peroxisomal 2 like protein [Verticillium longisporum]
MLMSGKSMTLETAVQECILKLDAVDFVLAGAARNFPAPSEGLSANAFRTVVNIELIGSYDTAKSTIPHLLESAARHKDPNTVTGGRRIFISATPHFTSQTLQAHVVSDSADVGALSASIALESGPRGLTSNVISAGGIEGTEGISRLSSLASREPGQLVRGCYSAGMGL